MLPEYFKKGPSAVEKEHFVKTKMLEDEPEKPLHAAGHHTADKAQTEEEKFDNSEAFDKHFLTKKYPSLALPNIANKEEIDILADLEEEDNTV